jgi:hypothetical protein
MVRRRRFSLNHWLRRRWQSISYRRRRLLFKILIGLIGSLLAVLSAWVVVQLLY